MPVFDLSNATGFRIGGSATEFMPTALMRAGTEIPVGPVTPAAPVNTVAPVTSGTTTLTSTTGSFTGGSGALTYQTRWQRSTDSGTTWAVISGQTGLTYDASAETAGNQIRSQRQATDAMGQTSGWASSNVITIGAPATVPARTTASTLTRTGDTINSAGSVWTGTQPMTFWYGWQRRPTGGGTWVNIVGFEPAETVAKTFAVRPEDGGYDIRMTERALNSAGSTGNLTSSNFISIPVAAVAPANTAAPVISGGAAEGDAYVHAGDTWTGSTPMTPTYLWEVSVANGAWTQFSTAASPLRPAGHAGNRVRLTKTMTNSVTGTSVVSNILSIAAASTADRTATPTSQQILFAGNSFDQTPNGAVTSDGSHGGNLVTNWPGGTLFDFVSFGTLEQVWNLDGNLRNDATWDVLVMSETPPSLETGYPTPGGDAFTQTSFQHAFWFAEEAKTRNADVILLVPWTPTGAEALRPNIAGWFTFLRNWLAQKTGRNVWLFPAHLCVKAMQDAGATPISGDGLHLDHAYSRVLSGALWYMLNQTPYPFVASGFEALDAACRDVIDDYRWAGLGGAVIETAVSASDPLVTPLPLPGDEVVPIAGTLTNPPVSARLGIYNERTARPFVNAFKQSWEWEGNNLGGDWSALVAAGRITPGGQIVSMPTGSDAGIRTRTLDSLTSETGATGRWRLTWTGEGTFDLFGANNPDQVNANTIEFDYTANGGSWVTVVARSAPISNIALVHEDDWADHAAGRIFRQEYLDEVRNYRTLRFDEWIGILRSEPYGLIITDWASRGLPTDEIMTHRFAPYEWFVQLCLEIGADPWICIPTAATDGHVESLAELLLTLVTANRVFYVERSTKTWDFAGTPQAHYFANEGRAYFDRDEGPEFLNFYGMRSALDAQIFREVWGNDPRLKFVVQHQADWVGNEYDILVAPQWIDAANPESPHYVPGCPPYVAPHTLFDVFTVHAQIDGGMAYGSAASLLETWRTTLTQTEAFNRIRDQMLTGPYHAVGDDGRRTVQLLTPKWQHYRTVANTYGLELAAYEVGNHLNGIGGSADLRAFMHLFSVSAQMGEVYTATFAAIRAAGFDGPLCMSVECRLPDDNIMHGLQRWLGDHNPAWTAVNAINLANDGPAGRGASDFVGTAEV